MGLFFNSKKQFVIIDIGSYAIKQAHFTIQRSKPILQSCSSFPISNNEIEEGDIMDVSSLTNNLSAFVNEKIPREVSKVHLTLGGRSILVKKIVVPTTEKELVDEFMEEEIKQTIPFDLEEINYNYTFLDSAFNPNPEQQSVLLVVIKNKVVIDADQLFKEMGVRVANIDINPLGIADYIKYMVGSVNKNKKSNYLVLDIGKSGTSFTVLNNFNLIFYKYIPSSGGDHFTHRLAQKMGVEYQEAEAFKIGWSQGQEVPPEVASIVAESCDSFCNEMMVGMEYFKNYFPYEDIEKVYILGGSAQLPGLSECIKSKLNISSEVLTTFDKLQCSSDCSTKNIEQSVHNLLGVALRN